MPQQNQNIEDSGEVGLFDFGQLLEESNKDNNKEDKKEEVQAKEESPEEPKKEAKEDKGKEQPKPEEKKEPKEKTSFSKIAQKYIDSGEWDDYKVKVGEEETAISEFEDMSEEDFFRIQEAQNKEKEKDFNEKYFNKEELDDVSKKIFDISRNGGDVTEVLNVKKNLIDKLNAFDLEDEQHQESLMRQKFRMEGSSLSPDDIDDLIQKYKEKDVLGGKAQEFSQKLRTSFDSKLQEEAKQAEENKRKEKENLRDFGETLKKEFDEMGLDKKEVKPFLDAATNKRKDGSFGIDDQFQELRKDPKRLADFLLWYNSPEEYSNKFRSRIGTEKDLKTLELLEKMPKSNKSKKREAPEKEDRKKQFMQEVEFK